MAAKQKEENAKCSLLFLLCIYFVLQIMIYLVNGQAEQNPDWILISVDMSHGACVLKYRELSRIEICEYQQSPMTEKVQQQ